MIVKNFWIPASLQQCTQRKEDDEVMFKGNEFMN